MQAMADASVDPERPGDWTHAVMDIGATLCTPRAPRCDDCPLRAWCRFSAQTARGPTAAAWSAPPGPGSARPSRAPAIPFSATTRWLRGRIVDRLRSASGAEWTAVEAPIGAHGTTAVRDALRALARDGVVELDATDPDRARLPA
jgi:adenine-specific DNA glycosylase